MKKMVVWIGCIISVLFVLTRLELIAYGDEDNKTRVEKLFEVPDTKRTVTNDLKPFELQLKKVDELGTQLSGAYFELIKTNATGDIEVVASTIQKAVGKSDAIGVVFFDGVYSHTATPSVSLDDFSKIIIPPSIIEADEKIGSTGLTDALASFNASDGIAQGYLESINTGTIQDVTPGYYVLQEIWAPYVRTIGSENEQLRRYSRPLVKMLIQISVGKNGIPYVMHRALPGGSWQSSEDILLGDSTSATTINLVSLPVTENELATGYGFAITKFNEADSNEKIDGAEFEISALTLNSMNEFSEYLAASGGALLDPLEVSPVVLEKVTTEDGIAKFSNLSKKSYYVIREAKAPNGFAKSNQAFLVYFDESDRYSHDGNRDGAIKVYGGTYQNGIFTMTLGALHNIDLLQDSVVISDSDNSETTVRVTKYLKVGPGEEDYQQFHLTESGKDNTIARINALLNSEGTPEATVSLSNGKIQIENELNPDELKHVIEIIKVQLYSEANYSNLSATGMSKFESLNSNYEVTASWEGTTPGGKFEPKAGTLVAQLQFGNEEQEVGFLPLTGKVFTHPLFLLFVGLMLATLGVFGYLKIGNEK